MDLLGHIDSTTLRSTSSNKKVAYWVVVDHRAHVIIYQSVPIDVHMKMHSFWTTRDVRLPSRPLSVVQLCLVIRCIIGIFHCLLRGAKYLGVLCLHALPVVLPSHHREPTISICVACSCSVEQRFVRDPLHLFQFLIHWRPEFESLC